jgi:hypothetical protein
MDIARWSPLFVSAVSLVLGTIVTMSVAADRVHGERPDQTRVGFAWLCWGSAALFGIGQAVVLLLPSLGLLVIVLLPACIVPAAFVVHGLKTLGWVRN